MNLNNDKNNTNNNNNNNDINYNAKIGKLDTSNSITSAFDEPMTTDTDFFTATNDDNFNRNGQTSNFEMVDAFGVGFNSNSGTSVYGDGKFAMPNNLRAQTTRNTSSPVGSGDFVDNFEHKFASLGISRSAIERKMGFDEDDSFADFSSAFNDNTQTSKSNIKSLPVTELKAKTSPKKLHPIRGSDFEKLNVNKDDTAATFIPKYSVDYSKSDQFDDDLAAALQRSLVDQ